MFFLRPFQCYRSHVDQIWPDGIFKPGEEISGLKFVKTAWL